MTAPTTDPNKPSVSELAAAIETAALMLDSEEHRYVERFAPCPNGCDYDIVTEIQYEGRSVQLEVPQAVRVAGPEDCDCLDGSVEDERAEHLDPLIGNLRAAATMLRQAGGMVR